MKSILSIYDLFPVLLLCLQTVLFLTSTMAVLRFLKLLQVPYAGMDYARLIKGAAILISVMLIGFCDMESVVQTVKTFHNYGDGFYRNVFIKFSHFIVVILIAEVVFGLFCFLVLRILPGFRQSSSDADDIPGAILQAIVILLVAVVVYTCTKAVVEPLTPRYINFN
jgi:membrane-bound acyltransferase YfiQ involved in biofilm formation